MQPVIQYDTLLQDAMRGVVRRVLKMVETEGLPGTHHFYVTFRTLAPGVVIPDHLHTRFPEEMTIVLQNQFYGLEVHDHHFEVTLSFNQHLERLSVPFDALTTFVDPSVSFGLQFQETSAEEDRDEDADLHDTATAETAEDASEPSEEAPVSNEKVVSLDQFRKK